MRADLVTMTLAIVGLVGAVWLAGMLAAARWKRRRP